MELSSNKNQQQHIADHTRWARAAMLTLIPYLNFLKFSLSDVLDILLVSILLYQLYRVLKGTLAYNIFIGLVLIYWLSILVQALEMRLLAKIMGQFLGAGFVLLVIVFQPEIRRFLFYVGRNSVIGKTGFLQNLLRNSDPAEAQFDNAKIEIVKAFSNMSNTKTGALIVIADSSEKASLVHTGLRINGEISSKLLESIFDKGSPLHDGAVLIAECKIIAAGCVLPVSENPDLPKRVGMRHRAAVGISEQIDAAVFIVSEQSGKISYAKNGKLSVNIPQHEFSELLENALRRSIQ